MSNIKTPSSAASKSQVVEGTSQPIFSTGSSIQEETLRVLHVDDDPAILEISKQVLMDMNGNLNFDSAYCVDEALKKIANGHYDVVVSDYGMPQKNGLEFLKEGHEQTIKYLLCCLLGKAGEEVCGPSFEFRG